MGMTAVGLQLAEVDERVAGIEPGSVGDVVEYRALGKVGLPDGAVGVQHGAGLLHDLVAAEVVDPLEKRRGEESAGAVAHHHRCAPLSEELRQRGHHGWVGGDGLFRRGAGDQIDLDTDFHPGFYPVKVSADGAQRLTAVFHLIVFAGLEPNLDHGAASFP